MKNITIPEGFNGAKFARKFNLVPGEYVLRPGRVLDCPSLPDLTEADLEDCVGPEETPPTLEEFLEAYSENEKGNGQRMKDLLERYNRTKKKPG